MTTFRLFRKKPLPWLRSIPSPLGPSPLSHDLPSGTTSELTKSPLPWISSHLSPASPHSITWNFRNGLPMSFVGSSGKNLSRRLDAENRNDEITEEDNEEEEWAGEITVDDITEELLRGEDVDADADWEEEEEVEAQLGDGGDGGGVVLGSTSWGSKALAIAEEVLLPFKDIQIYSFKASHRGYIYVRLDKLSNKYGCPTIDDIKTFHSLYAEHLEEVAQTGDVPDNLAVEVSSPGAERFVRVPEELERFKDLPMYVRYIIPTTETEAESKEQDGIFQLDSINLEFGHCTWKVANVKINREATGRGRSLSKRKRDWRLLLPFSQLKFARLYMEG